MNIRWKLLTIAVLWGAVLSPVHAFARSPANIKADRVVILKSKRQLQLWNKDSLLKTYRVALGGTPVGRKTEQGDHRTPEGNYVIAGRNENSKYHRSLRISYPNADDRIRAAKRGVSPRGDIMIHGLPNGYGWVGRGHLAKDWTDGCTAVTDQEIEEIWRLVPNGIPVEMKP